MAELSIAIAPAALSFMIAAISCVVPPELLMASVSLLKSSGAALMIASIPDIASLPKSIEAAEACVDSSSPPIFSRSCPMTSPRDSIFPSASVREMPYWSMTVAMFLVGDAMFVIAVRSVVPACDALIPLFAMSPSATAVSSAEYPNAPATGATYLNDSPSMETFVLALLDAAARISANRPLSAAVRPNAVRASVTISEVVPRLSPEAAARFIMPARPSTICPASQPAIAMYW